MLALGFGTRQVGRRPFADFCASTFASDDITESVYFGPSRCRCHAGRLQFSAVDRLEHDDPCPKWDSTYPVVTQGQCSATDATGDAIAYAGTVNGHVVLADGRWIVPSGSDSVFSDLHGGLTSGLTLVPGEVSQGRLRYSHLAV